MSISRPGVWIAFALLFGFHTVILFAPPPLGELTPGDVIDAAELWPAAGRFMLALNVFFPVAAGILSADRMRRDMSLGIRELQESTPLRDATYLMSKYVGVLLSLLLPLLVWSILVALVMVAIGHAPVGFVGAVPLAFLAIVVPAFSFVVAFSIACPMVMPVSVYQILFTGYWFWANFIPPALFPTLNGTLLTPNGMFACEAFFGGGVSEAVRGPLVRTPAEAIANLLVLTLLVVSVLTLLRFHLHRVARRA